MGLKVKRNFLGDAVSQSEIKSLEKEIFEAHDKLHNGTGEGSDCLGWLTLPEQYKKSKEFTKIKKFAKEIRKDVKLFVVIGIGGSYLGARAVIEAIKSQNHNLANEGPEIFFAGNGLSANALAQLAERCKNTDFAINVISKSGKTTEPAVAFRILRKILEENCHNDPEKISKRIFITTETDRGALRFIADELNCEKFVVPENVGGRYSVLTAVGLLPIAVAGVDIDKLMDGAIVAQKAYECCSVEENECYKYAAIRNLLYRKDKKIEIFVSYEPDFQMMGEWLKQLFGESEGKDGKGIFPSSAIFSTDLHSLGQYIQEGERHLFETVIVFEKSKEEQDIPKYENDFDELNDICKFSLSEINKIAFEATAAAHVDGGVPNIIIELEKMDEFNIGELIYFFEKACGISGYVLNVNPFDQPGVEKYKDNMYALLGRPGYEELKKRLERRIKDSSVN